MEVEDRALEAKKRGNAHYKKKEYDEAIACYEEAITINPKEITYWGNKIAVLTTQKKYDEGHKVVQEALDIYKDLDYADKDFKKLGKIYFRRARLFEL